MTLIVLWPFLFPLCAAKTDDCRMVQEFEQNSHSKRRYCLQKEVIRGHKEFWSENHITSAKYFDMLTFIVEEIEISQK